MFRHGAMSTCEFRVGDLHVNKWNNEQVPREKMTAGGRGTAWLGGQPALPSVKGEDQQRSSRRLRTRGRPVVSPNSLLEAAGSGLGCSLTYS